MKSDDVLEALMARAINCSVPEQFDKLASVNKFPVCLLPTRLACNNEMLGKLGADIVKLKYIDLIEEWSKKAQTESECLN